MFGLDPTWARVAFVAGTGLAAAVLSALSLPVFRLTAKRKSAPPALTQVALAVAVRGPPPPFWPPPERGPDGSFNTEDVFRFRLAQELAALPDRIEAQLSRPNAPMAPMRPPPPRPPLPFSRSRLNALGYICGNTFWATFGAGLGVLFDILRHGSFGL